MKKLYFTILLLLIGVPLHAGAYTISDSGLSVSNNILLEPAKIDFSIGKLETKTFDIHITNLTSSTKTFAVTIKDVVPSDDEEEVVKVLESVPKIANYVVPEISQFTLRPGEVIKLPVRVRTDLSIDSGGYSAGVFVTDISKSEGFEANFRSSLGVLTFIKVGDDVREAGLLSDFRTADDRKVYFGGQIPLVFTFENEGNVHLNPYGQITVRNLFGSEVEVSEVSPWFVLPQSMRSNRAVNLDTEWKFGKYTINLEMNRGYDNEIDRETIHIYVFSWRVTALVLIALLILIAVVKRYRRINKGNSGRGVWFTLYIILLIIALAFIITYKAKAEVATSTNYILERDSINIAGSNSTSTNYIIEDTVGEVATGRSTSTNYVLNAGYQQLDATVLTITAPSDVSLSSDIHPINGGQSNGSATWTVVTNSANGYSLSIKASSDPAMAKIGGGDSFADYTPLTADPDYTWSVPSGSYEFGYSPNGDDISSKWKNDGVSDCNSGSNITDLVCWDGPSTSNVLIATDTGGNYPDGATTTVNFRAESNSGTPESGDYRATLTLTALAL